MRHYATPLAFKTALEQRLREEAKRTGTSLDRVRQLLIFDRFLSRTVSIFKESVVLKGGLAVELRLGKARTTKDIDLRLVGNPEKVLAGLQEAGQIDSGDFLSFEVAPDARHPEITADGMIYQGQRYRGEAKLAGKIYGRPFGIDVAFADPIASKPEMVRGSSLLMFAGIEPSLFPIYPLTSHVAEKLHAYTLPRDRPNSRVKDLPDIAFLAGAGPIEGADLRASIDQTFQHRKTHPVPLALPSPPETWSTFYEGLVSEDGLRWKTLDEVFQAAKQFIDPILLKSEGLWNPTTWKWE